MGGHIVQRRRGVNKQGPAPQPPPKENEEDLVDTVIEIIEARIKAGSVVSRQFVGVVLKDFGINTPTNIATVVAALTNDGREIK